MSLPDGLITGRTAQIPDEPAPAKKPARHWTHYARGRKKVRGEMNRTETQFLNEVIMPRVETGEVVAWWYETITFRLTDKTPSGKPGTRYTPDFVVVLDTYELVCFEVKGSGIATTADLNRVKAASQKFPLRFYVATRRAKKDGGGFRIEEY